MLPINPKAVVKAALASGLLSHSAGFAALGATAAPKRPIKLPCEVGLAKEIVPCKRRGWPMYKKREAKSLRYVIHIKNRPDLKEVLDSSV